MSRYKSLDFANGSQQAILSGAISKDKQRGLVIVRCSYESQEKWDTFLSIDREQILHQIESRDVQLPDIDGPDIFENLLVTVIEDRVTLEGANLKISTDKFVEWLRTAGLNELKEKETHDSYAENLDNENLDNKEFLMNLPGIPRYRYFIHADKEMIESFSVDLNAIGPIDEVYSMGNSWKTGHNFLHIVSPSSVLADIEWQQQDRGDIGGGDEDEEEDNDEQGNLSKKVRGETLLDLYVKLLKSFDHFYHHDHEGFWVIS